jgi:hypothetical protein
MPGEVIDHGLLLLLGLLRKPCIRPAAAASVLMLRLALLPLLLLQRLKEPLRQEREAGLARQAAAMKRLQAEKHSYVKDVSYGFGSKSGHDQPEVGMISPKSGHDQPRV